MRGILVRHHVGNLAVVQTTDGAMYTWVFSASPPLGASIGKCRWFPALKRRAGVALPPFGGSRNLRFVPQVFGRLGATDAETGLPIVRAEPVMGSFPMPVITLTTSIAAPIEVVFDLARSIDLHRESTVQTNERAVAGRTSGLIGLGEEVTWEATHFFIRQRLTSKIVQFDRPHHLRDSMVSGAFRRFDHDHHFVADGQGTVMTDTFDYTSPLGLLGRLADGMFLKRYMERLLMRRNQVIKQVAESGDSRRFCSPS